MGSQLRVIATTTDALNGTTSFTSSSYTIRYTDTNNNGLVDGLTNYHLFHNGEAISLTEGRNDSGRSYSDAYSSYWDAIAATSSDSGFQVLLDGASSYEGKYYLWDTNSSGVITKGSGWKTAAEAAVLGWETTFNSDLNGDGVTAQRQFQDANNDGLVDGLSDYHLFHNGEAIALTEGWNKSRKSYSNGSSKYWDAIAATQNGSGFQVLIEGTSSNEGKYYLWDTNSSGAMTQGSGWKTATEAAVLGWETSFNSDLNGDGVTGKPQPKDANNDGLVDGLTNYHLFHNGEAIALIEGRNDSGRAYSDAFSKHWDAIAANQNGSGFQVLLEGASSYEGKYYLWDTNSSGVITKGSGWKTAADAAVLGWETTFNSDLNGDGALTEIREQSLI